MYPLAEIMTTELRTLGPDQTLGDARALMSKHNIRHIPIVKQDELVGLVSQRDLLSATDSSLYSVSEDQQEERENWIRVSDFMTDKVVSVDIQADMMTAARYLEKHKLGCLPVLDDGKLVGIVTETDFVALSINLLEQLQRAEPSAPDTWEI